MPDLTQDELIRVIREAVDGSLSKSIVTTLKNLFIQLGLEFTEEFGAYKHCLVLETLPWVVKVASSGLMHGEVRALQQLKSVIPEHLPEYVVIDEAQVHLSEKLYRVGFVPETEVIKIALKAASCGIGDLHPGNFGVKRDGTPCLFDFGGHLW